MLEYELHAAAAFLSRRLPLGFSYWLGMRVADLYHRADLRGREAVRSNIRRILAHRGVHPAKGSVEVFSRKMYQYFGKYLVDFYRYSRATAGELEGRCSVEHMDHLREAAALGRGVVVVTAHVGNWELGGMVLAMEGFPLTAVFRPHAVRRLDHLFRSQRRRRGIRGVALGRAVRGMLQALRRNELVAILADRDFTNQRHRVRFFGEEACMPHGPAQIALRAGAPIVPCFMLRQVDDRFLMRCFPPIYPEREGGLEAIQRRIVLVMEQVIGENPFQWFVFEDFWKREHDDS